VVRQPSPTPGRTDEPSALHGRARVYHRLLAGPSWRGVWRVRARSLPARNVRSGERFAARVGGATGALEHWSSRRLFVPAAMLVAAVALHLVDGKVALHAWQMNCSFAIDQ